MAVFPNLKPSTETISLRVPTALLSELKALANRRDVPYQSLLKMYLAERVDHETAGALANRALQTTSRAQHRGNKKRRARAARG